MKRTNPRSAAMMLALVVAGAAGTVSAQAEFPSKPIRFIVGFAPGGGTDIVARVIGQKLDETWRQRVIVDNRPGAAQIIASELTAKATPDGHTIFLASAGFTITPAFNQKLPFDPIRDFSPIIMAASAPNVLVINPSFPARSVKEVLAAARAKPGQLNYGSGGLGAPSHLSGALFGALGQVQITHIPYKGSGPAMIDLLGGQLHLSFPDLSTALPHLKSGKLMALAVTTPQRSTFLPEIPTVEESGLPGYEASSWFAVMGPAGIPEDVVLKLNGAINRILNDPDMRTTLAAQGASAVGGTPQDLAKTVLNEIAKWKKVVSAAGIKTE